MIVLGPNTLKPQVAAPAGTDRTIMLPGSFHHEESNTRTIMLPGGFLTEGKT